MLPCWEQFLVLLLFLSTLE